MRTKQFRHFGYEDAAEKNKQFLQRQEQMSLTETTATTIFGAKYQDVPFQATARVP